MVSLSVVAKQEVGGEFQGGTTALRMNLIYITLTPNPHCEEDWPCPPCLPCYELYGCNALLQSCSDMCSLYIIQFVSSNVAGILSTIIKLRLYTKYSTTIPTKAVQQHAKKPNSRSKPIHRTV